MLGLVMTVATMLAMNDDGMVLLIILGGIVILILLLLAAIQGDRAADKRMAAKRQEVRKTVSQLASEGKLVIICPECNGLGQIERKRTHCRKCAGMGYIETSIQPDASKSKTKSESSITTKQSWSGFAIAGFIMSFLPETTFLIDNPSSEHSAYAIIMTALALIFSSMGIGHIRSKRRQRGITMGVIGLVLSIINAVAIIAILSK